MEQKANGKKNCGMGEKRGTGTVIGLNVGRMTGMLKVFGLLLDPINDTIRNGVGEG